MSDCLKNATITVTDGAWFPDVPIGGSDGYYIAMTEDIPVKWWHFWRGGRRGPQYDYGVPWWKFWGPCHISRTINRKYTSVDHVTNTITLAPSGDSND